MSTKRYVGADGCRTGWFAVAIDETGGAAHRIFDRVESLWAAHWDSEVILMDIPIGLNSRGKDHRTCDTMARNVLKPFRHSSVFTAPFREALSAGSYEAACRINHGLCGKRLSRQVWNIAGKIKEVDDFLTGHPEAAGMLRETHPEVCFWALNGRRPMAHRKKSAAGAAERIHLLERAYPGAGALYSAALGRYPRRDLSPDDILDAMVNAVTATRLEHCEATLPADPPRDALGLPMEMVYASSETAA